MNTLKKIRWSHVLNLVTPNWSLNHFGKQKTVLAFEFGIVLSDVAKTLGIEMTSELAARAETLLVHELRHHDSQYFACNMNVFILALLEPKD